MQLIKKKESFGNTLFLLGIILELIVMITDHFASFTLPYRGRVTHVAFVLFCIAILTTYYTKKQWFILVCFMALGVVSYFTCHDEYVIRFVVLAAASKDKDIESALKIIFWSSLVGALMVIFLAVIGVAGNMVDIRDYGRDAIEARYTLGFNHANNVHDMLWYLISLCILIKKEKTAWWQYVIMTVLNIILYQLTISRTGLIATQIVILGGFGYRYVDVVKKYGLIYLGCGVGLVLSVFLTIYGSIYNIGESRLIATLDPFLTGRLEMLTEYANFKQWVAFPTARSSAMVDNGFSSIIYVYGTIVGMIFIALIIFMILKLAKKEAGYVAVVLLGTVLVTFMEATFIINVSLLCNMILLVFMSDIYDIKLFADNSFTL